MRVQHVINGSVWPQCDGSSVGCAIAGGDSPFRACARAQHDQLIVTDYHVLDVRTLWPSAAVFGVCTDEIAQPSLWMHSDLSRAGQRVHRTDISRRLPILDQGPERRGRGRRGRGDRGFIRTVVSSQNVSGEGLRRCGHPGRIYKGYRPLAAASMGKRWVSARGDHGRAW